MRSNFIVAQALAIFFALISHSNITTALTEPSAEADALVHQAQATKLAQHPYWMALMHYRRTAPDRNTALNSEIISPDFFLSPYGATDSGSELEATLAAFFKTPGNDPDNHAQCRFPARYKWLRKSLDWGGLRPPSVACKQFDDWSMHGHFDSLSLVFASGYLSNPASFYGHLLLKFNTDRKVLAADILDESINFGAIVPSNENGVVYVLKGLFGGYDASYSNTRFYRQNHLYAENELRDMWEYELALSKDEVDQISAHSWELLHTRFRYFFLKENCAYQMAELLELVIGQPLLPRDLPWSLPATVFDRLATLQRNGAPLVRKVRLIPSRLNSLHTKYAALNSTQKLITNELAHDTSNLKSTPYIQLVEAEKISVLDTLLDYYEFRIVAEQGKPDLKKAKQEFLIERAALASQSSLTSDNPSRASATSPPHEGSRPGMIRLGLLHNSHLGTGTELHLRPVYYDLLQPDVGHIANSNLTMFDFRMIYANSRLSLRSLELVNIETLNVARTPLPGDGGPAWKVKFGFATQNLACENCMTFNITGGIGKATPITSKITGYAMLDLSAQTKYQDSGTAGAVARVGLIGSPVDGWKSNFTLGQRVYSNDTISNRHSIRWENRLGNHRDWDIRISYEEQVAREYQVTVSTYW